MGAALFMFHSLSSCVSLLNVNRIFTSASVGVCQTLTPTITAHSRKHQQPLTHMRVCTYVRIHGFID